MTALMSLDNHKYLHYTDDIKTICSPIFECTDIDCFLYVRVYEDNRRLQLGTNPDWLRHYVEHDYHVRTPLTNNVDTQQNHYILYNTCMENEVFQAAVNDFDMHDGIILTNKMDKYIEFFHFSSKSPQNNCLQFYLNNLNLLEKFNLYFKESAQDIIAETKPLITASPQKSILPKETLNLLCEQEAAVLEDIQFDTLCLSVGNDIVFLTKYELVCLTEYLHGKTAKEISDSIFRSRRTVEHHIKMIKNKLRCKNRMEVFHMLEKNHLFNILYHYKSQS